MDKQASVPIHQQLRGARQAAGLTQEELADRLEISQGEVARLESPGGRNYTVNSLRRYAEALGGKYRLEVRIVPVEPG